MLPDSQRQHAAAQTTTGTVIDAGLQSFMRGVFNAMALGLGITGLAAFGVANTPALFNVIFGTPLAWVVMFAPLAFVWFGFTPGRVARMSAQKVRTTFYVFSALMGVSMAAIFQVFAGADIARAFFVTAATFAATALYGYVTRRDLSGMGSFLFMGLIGVVIASIINVFLGSQMIHFIISVVGVFVFTGLTAFQVQSLKETYAYGNGEANSKLATMGALNLYLNFVNLFQIILHFMGGNRE